MDSPTLMSVKQMIDEAFGDPRTNVVNHKLIHAILIIFARQIRLLERQVEVNFGPIHETASAARLNVSEVKMYANVPKRQTTASKAGGGGGAGGRRKTSVTLTEQPSLTNLPQKYLSILDKIETLRETQLRVIHQRADSREEQKKEPSPIRSLDEMEQRYEKLLIVERVPSGQDGPAKSERGPRFSVVTQEEFAELAAIVKHLQEQLFPIGTAGFPENAELMDELRKGASLTDAMAALQLSARLEAAEKALEKMLSLVTDLAKAMGSSIEGKTGKSVDTKGDVIFKEDDTISRTSAVSKKIEPPAKSKGNLGQKPAMDAGPGKSVVGATEQESEKADKDWITAEELDDAMQALYDEFMKVVNTNTAKSNANANSALKIANKLERRLADAMDFGDRMEEVEQLVSEYAEHVNTLDTGLSAQITNYQEQLTQMQHDLESGIESMQEALANTGGDTAAVAELNNNFTILQVELDAAAQKQKELRDEQKKITTDLRALWKQIEVLRDEKSDRDEVADALRDKAGISALNGLVSRPEFDAVRGDLEKQIGAAYDKFNNQEVIWQKAIDELLRELSEKADLLQVVSLQESIEKYLQAFNDKIKAIAEIVGEPRAAAVSRKLHRDAACLSCKTPAHMDLEEPNIGATYPEFPSRPSTEGAEAKLKPSEDGDGNHRGICYPGHPIPHPVDPRAHVCRRFCGGSHTLLNTLSRAPPGVTINTLPATQKRDVTPQTVIGTDGKAYVVDHEIKPCKACYKQEVPPTSAPTDPEIPTDRQSSGMTPPDYRMSVISGVMKRTESEEDGGISITPPHLLTSD